MAVPHPSGRIRVTQGEEPVEKEVLAEAIVRIGAAAQALRQSGLNRRGVIVLLQAKTHLSRETITTVLDGLEDLKRDYCA